MLSNNLAQSEITPVDLFELDKKCPVNACTLREARANFGEYGASCERWRGKTMTMEEFLTELRKGKYYFFREEYMESPPCHYRQPSEPAISRYTRSLGHSLRSIWASSGSYLSGLKAALGLRW